MSRYVATSQREAADTLDGQQHPEGWPPQSSPKTQAPRLGGPLLGPPPLRQRAALGEAAGRTAVGGWVPAPQGSVHTSCLFPAAHGQPRPSGLARVDGQQRVKDHKHHRTAVGALPSGGEEEAWLPREHRRVLPALGRRFSSLQGRGHPEAKGLRLGIRGLKEVRVLV